jgi:hypothetical protein
MPNAVKYKTGNLTGSLQKGDVALGISGSLGPTSTTGWYNGPNPVAGKYQIFETAASGDPDVYSPQDDAELIKFARWKGATGADTGSAAAVLAWIGTQTNLMAANFEYENIVTDGLILNLDAGFVGSYPTINTTWYDISGNANNGALTNGPTFNSANSGSIVFDGVDDYATVSSLNLTGITENFTFITVIKFPTFNNGGVIVWQAFSSYWALITNTSFGAANLAFTTRGTRGLAAVSSTLTANQWYYVVCKREAGVNSLYINNTIYTYTSGVDFPGGTLFKIGTDGNNNYFFNGNLALIQLYNRALTQTEIMQNYNTQKGRFGL